MKALIDDPIAWGEKLISTRDIDPIYDMLWRAYDAQQIGQPQIARWLVVYWCCYHAGAASKISEYEGEDFWEVMRIAAANLIRTHKGDRWPRSSERRHWRGPAAIRCVETLSRFYPSPELMALAPLEGLTAPAPLEKVRANVERWPLFGPWISFKVADMLERVLGYNIEFPEDVSLYDSPRKGLQEAVHSTGANTSDELLNGMTQRYLRLDPPGRPSRICGVQEFETIFCKWHSARSNHYYIGKDLKEIRHALEDDWGVTATILANHLPEEVV